MSEEEIIQVLENIILDINNYGEIVQSTLLIKKAIQSLLDLYNKRLEEYFYEKELRVKYELRYDRLKEQYNKEKEKNEICLKDLEEMTKSNEHKKENWIHKSILNSYISKDKIRELREIDNIDYLQFKLKELLGE